jgi:hypothetical protein
MNPELLSWENFAEHYVVPGEQRVHRVNTRPLFEVFADATSGRIGLWVEIDDSDQVPTQLQSLAVIQSSVLVRRGVKCIEVATSIAPLFRHFYFFSLAVAQGVVTGAQNRLQLLCGEFDHFSSLFQENNSPGIERQLGLLGELLFLDRLIKQRGQPSIDAWVAPLRDNHDFRINNKEFEVKTTLGSKRIHTINGCEQLLPSPGFKLHIASVLVGPPGSHTGFCLSEIAQRIASALENRFLDDFDGKLASIGFPRDGLDKFGRRYALRRNIALVAVADKLPAITPSSLQTLFQTESSRISGVSYDLNLEGLCVDETDPLFAEVVG